MMLQHRPDGTYAITGMTRADVDNLAFGVTCAESFTHSTTETGDAVWRLRRIATFERLSAELRRLIEHDCGRPIRLASDTFAGGYAPYAREGSRR